MNVVLNCQAWNPFWHIPDNELEKLQQQFPEIRFINTKSIEELRAAIPEGEILFGYRLEAQYLATAVRLKWIHVPAASVNGFNITRLQERRILLTNSRGMHATPIAEHVLGCMLVFSRRFIDCWRFQNQHHYAQLEMLNHPPPLTELKERTVVILGLGGIGREVTRLCKAFGMRVLATKRRTDRKASNVDELYDAGEFRTILPRADYVVIAMPRTNETEGLIGEQELALLKPECVIINVARGKIIQEPTLIRFLKEGRIRGAALDVFETEPLPSDSELFSLPNVFLTPHVSGVSTAEHWPRLMDLFQENLQRYLSGRPLLNVVDYESGY